MKKKCTFSSQFSKSHELAVFVFFTYKKDTSEKYNFVIFFGYNFSSLCYHLVAASENHWSLTFQALSHEHSVEHSSHKLHSSIIIHRINIPEKLVDNLKSIFLGMHQY